MKKIPLFLIFLLLTPIIPAQDWLFNSEYLDLSLEISGKMQLIPTSPIYKVDYVIANLSFIPQDSFQEKVSYIQTEPSSEIKEGTSIFKWEEPTEKELSFNLKSNIKSFNKIIEVKEKIQFPLNNLPDEIKEYTQPSETIDSDNKEIIRKGSELIQGEDDLYVIVYKLAEWTKNNIKYDLSTLTASVTQKASWVLTKKEGVCDELTNLFIAMSRALGIPAKFISGVAYTNSERIGEGFGPHGWAEVYFPNYGWVPFDVTYGEFGFVDSGHVKLKESLDANDASTKFQWIGKNINIKTYPLDVKVDLKNSKGRIPNLISLDAAAVKNDIGFGSYNIIKATIKNLKDCYISADLILSKPKEIEITGEEDKKTLLLKPNEEKKVSWIIKVSDNLEQGYLYTFPFVVSSLRNITSELRFDVIENGKKFSLEGIKELVEESEEEKSYLGNIELNCKTDKHSLYEYESSTIECNIKNIGNVYLEDINACLEEDCKKMDLGITQNEKINFNFKPKIAGAQEAVIKASNKDVSKSTFLDVTVYDKPSIEIAELTHPEEVRYKDVYEISFILNKLSKFPPYNITIKIEPSDEEWTITQLNENRKFILKMYGNKLRVGENNLKVSIDYKDKNGKSYEKIKEFKLNLVDANIFQRIIIFFKGLFK